VAKKIILVMGLLGVMLLAGCTPPPWYCEYSRGDVSFKGACSRMDEFSSLDLDRESFENDCKEFVGKNLYSNFMNLESGPINMTFGEFKQKEDFALITNFSCEVAT